MATKAERISELERTLHQLEIEIEKARVSAAEIYDSGDESRYWVARMFEGQIAASTRTIRNTRRDIERWTGQP